MALFVKQYGQSSLSIERDVYVCASASIVGTKEGQGPLAAYFDKVVKDDQMGCHTWEDAESKLQKEAVIMVLEKAKKQPSDIRYLIAGDLLGQSIATSFGLMDFEIPLFGLYGACSTCGESLGLASILLASGAAEHIISVTSSHFASAEKEFRFPMEYGNQRPPSSTWTVTGSGAFVLGTKKSELTKVKIAGVTTGKIIDYGIKDPMNMGACMAPAACDTIMRNFEDFGRTPDYYDRIITGDLGSVGQEVLWKLMKEQGYDLSGNHIDCGIEIYDSDVQDTKAGGSGCGCSAVTMASYILPKIESGDWKRVLFIPTGALMSKTSYNEGQTIPSIAHGVVLEQIL
ncbi:MAG: stage V sporulation protein AD [Eubacteriales bacterium]